MDALRLLSRGTKSQSHRPTQRIPSAEVSKPQLFSDERPTKRRKTSEQEITNLTAPETTTLQKDRKVVLKRHKIKVAWLQQPKKQKKKHSTTTSRRIALFPEPLIRFDDLTEELPSWLRNNVGAQAYREATEVQMAAIPLLTNFAGTALDEDATIPDTTPDLLTVAPTGSGKTLAFLIPALSGVHKLRKAEQKSVKALILAPTKELVGQIVNEGQSLVRGSGIKISAFRKDMRLVDLGGDDARTIAKPDVLVSTPGNLYTTSAEGDVLPDVQYLILDEADVLLDPLFREQTVGIWKSLSNHNLRISLWSATMGSNIEDLTRSIILERQTKYEIDSIAPFVQLVVGLKDSAVPNVQHRLIYAATEQGKLMGLRQLLHPSTPSADSGPALRPPFIVFTQTIERAVALHSELLYDIPAEAGGISRIAVLHSDLSDTARDGVMTRFREGEIWVLITTDLLSRGIDFRGVNGVVNYDIPSSSAAYVHRAGRTGRAGREGGVAVTLYSKEDIPYLKHVANVIAAAQKAGSVSEGSGIQQWLLDSLPTLSRNDKQKFKKHGLESRTSHGQAKDPKAARKARISTKSGFIRREENNRRGAIEGSRRRKLEAEDNGSDDDFAGFA